MRALLLIAFIHYTFLLNAQFAPPVGQIGTTAIHKDSSIIVEWAAYASIERGLINISDPTAEFNGSNYATFGTIENTLGPASGELSNVISLGDRGQITLTFNRYIIDGEGPDFCVFGNSLNDTFLELAFVEVSSDGEHFVRFPSVSLSQTETQISGFGEVDAEKIYNLAGKYKVGYGVPFDLAELSDTSGIDIMAISHVRIIDVVGTIDTLYSSYDSQGNIINDPFPTPFDTGGFDLEAIGVINAGSTILATSSNNTQQKAEIYPNPTSDFIHIKGNTGLVYIKNVNGKIIKSFSHDKSSKVDIRELPKGLYFIQISTAKGNVIEKIMVQ